MSDALDAYREPGNSNFIWLGKNGGVYTGRTEDNYDIVEVLQEHGRIILRMRGVIEPNVLKAVPPRYGMTSPTVDHSIVDGSDTCKITNPKDSNLEISVKCLPNPADGDGSTEISFPESYIDDKNVRGLVTIYHIASWTGAAAKRAKKLEKEVEAAGQPDSKSQ
jgi:hypothetical protein